MSGRCSLLVLAWCLALAGCDAPGPGAAAPTLPDRDDGRVQWQGQLACADCIAIDTRLQLSRASGANPYTLTEIYQAGDGEARFDERGQWRQHDALLWLRASDGAERVYVLLPDGRLRPSDRRGRPLSRRQDDFLLPVTQTPAP